MAEDKDIKVETEAGPWRLLAAQGGIELANLALA
jgi:hypothetical protein